LLIAAIFFLPGAIRDGVFNRDGSYNWMYVDTQYFSAIASSVKSSAGVPKTPGMGIADLNYHFGPHATAGAVSAALGISTGDAVARIVRPSGLLALLLAVYSLGSFLSWETSGETRGGILAAAGLFFYGSLASLFAVNVNSASLVSGAILLELPSASVAGNGGPFNHLIVGGSQVPGLIGLFISIRLILAKLTASDARYMKPDLLTLLPAAVFPSSLLVGIGSLGLQASLFAWFGRSSKHVWISIFVMVCTGILSAWAMGYIGPHATPEKTEFKPALLITKPETLFVFVLWFFIGLGLRIFAFARVKNPLRDAVSAALLVSVLGFVSLSVLFVEYYWSNNRYGLLFAGSILSVFSFAWLFAPFREAFKGNSSGLLSAVADTMRFAMFSGMAFLVLTILAWSIVGSTDPNSRYSLKLAFAASIAVLLSTVAARFFIVNLNRARPIIVFLILGVYSLGFTAWIADWLNFGLGRMKMDIVVSSGEVVGLATLRNISKKGDLVATNHHSLPNFSFGPERAYGYGALSERPMLLEGWKSSGGENHPLFEKVKRANDLLFSTSDASVARDIVRSFDIRFIVAQPGTDLLVTKSLPSWLVPISDSGSLTIYRVAN
jgi:hypothetical protein